MGWQPRGDNYKVFWTYINEYGIDISHFSKKVTNIGNCLNSHNEKTAEEYSKGRLIKLSRLMDKMLKENVKEYKCEICGISEWNNKYIKLQIHHINGNHYDNDINNIQFLCPNCHSQTDTFCGKNRKNKNEKVFCKKCGKEKYLKTETNLCIECYKQSVRNPNRETKLYKWRF